MKQVRYLRSFRKDFKRIERRHYRIEKLGKIIDLLRNEEPLPISNRPHLLQGDWKGYWECYIAPDWLLIYKLTNDELVLAGTGTHADLFE